MPHTYTTCHWTRPDQTGPNRTVPDRFGQLIQRSSERGSQTIAFSAADQSETNRNSSLLVRIVLKLAFSLPTTVGSSAADRWNSLLTEQAPHPLLTEAYLALEHLVPQALLLFDVCCPPNQRARHISLSQPMVAVCTRPALLLLTSPM